MIPLHGVEVVDHRLAVLRRIWGAGVNSDEPHLSAANLLSDSEQEPGQGMLL